MDSVIGGATLGAIVATVHPGQRPAASYAAEATARIVHVADQAPEPIRAQARAFRAQVEAVILGYLAAAVAEQRDYDAAEADRMGRHDVAAAIRARR